MKPDNISVGAVVDRVKSPTPKFFKKLRRIFIWAGAIGGAILTMGPMAPAPLAVVAPWLATAGAVGAAVSTLPKEGDQEQKPEPENPSM